MELKDHNVSQETKQHFEELKTNYPELFSFSNEDNGCTQLVTMDIDTGGPSTSVPKTIHPSSQTLYLGSTGNRDIRTGWTHQEEHQPMDQSYHHYT